MSSALTAPMVRSTASGNRRQHWLSVVTHTDPRYGGLSTVVPRTSYNVSRITSIDVSMAAFCLPKEQLSPEGFDDAHLSFWPASRSAWLSSRGLREQFKELISRADGVHIHGLWEASTAVAARTADMQGKPYLLSAHGMLEPWALANKRLRKLVYAAVLERRTVAQATCLHALTQAEAEQYRRFGADAPIAVIPNAVEIPAHRSPAAFLARFPHLRDRRRLLFLGRLHPKKGLALLIEAWRRIATGYPEVELVIAGPDGSGIRAKLEDAIAQAGVAGSVTFTGMLDRELKWSALAAAECFVLPSFSEGLSVSVLEALGAGVPVIVTHNCNMPEVTRMECGWEIAPDANELTYAMENVLRRSPEANRVTGKHGAQLIATKYEPSWVAAQMAELYEFALNGTIPTLVDLL